MLTPLSRRPLVPGVAHRRIRPRLPLPTAIIGVSNVSVMRRRADSWLNATQILKVAGVDKGIRTKILESDVVPGVHEKVQGGYGKYQGTWFVSFVFRP